MKTIRKLYVALTRGRYATLVGVVLKIGTSWLACCWTRMPRILASRGPALCQVCPDIAVQPCLSHSHGLIDLARLSLELSLSSRAKFTALGRLRATPAGLRRAGQFR